MSSVGNPSRTRQVRRLQVRFPQPAAQPVKPPEKRKTQLKLQEKPKSTTPTTPLKVAGNPATTLLNGVPAGTFDNDSTKIARRRLSDLNGAMSDFESNRTMANYRRVESAREALTFSVPDPSYGSTSGNRFQLGTSVNIGGSVDQSVVDDSRTALTLASSTIKFWKPGALTPLGQAVGVGQTKAIPETSWRTELTLSELGRVRNVGGLLVLETIGYGVIKTTLVAPSRGRIPGEPGSKWYPGERLERDTFTPVAGAKSLDEAARAMQRDIDSPSWNSARTTLAFRPTKPISEMSPIEKMQYGFALAWEKSGGEIRAALEQMVSHDGLTENGMMLAGSAAPVVGQAFDLLMLGNFLIELGESGGKFVGGLYDLSRANTLEALHKAAFQMSAFLAAVPTAALGFITGYVPGGAATKVRVRLEKGGRRFIRDGQNARVQGRGASSVPKLGDGAVKPISNKEVQNLPWLRDALYNAGVGRPIGKVNGQDVAIHQLPENTTIPYGEAAFVTKKGKTVTFSWKDGELTRIYTVQLDSKSRVVTYHLPDDLRSAIDSARKAGTSPSAPVNQADAPVRGTTKPVSNAEIQAGSAVGNLLEWTANGTLEVNKQPVRRLQDLTHIDMEIPGSDQRARVFISRAKGEDYVRLSWYERDAQGKVVGRHYHAKVNPDGSLAVGDLPKVLEARIRDARNVSNPGAGSNTGALPKPGDLPIYGRQEKFGEAIAKELRSNRPGAATALWNLIKHWNNPADLQRLENGWTKINGPEGSRSGWVYKSRTDAGEVYRFHTDQDGRPAGLGSAITRASGVDGRLKLGDVDNALRSNKAGDAASATPESGGSTDVRGRGAEGSSPQSPKKINNTVGEDGLMNPKIPERAGVRDLIEAVVLGSLEENGRPLKLQDIGHRNHTYPDAAGVERSVEVNVSQRKDAQGRPTPWVDIAWKEGNTWRRYTVELDGQGKIKLGELPNALVSRAQTGGGGKLETLTNPQINGNKVPQTITDDLIFMASNGSNLRRVIGDGVWYTVRTGESTIKARFDKGDVAGTVKITWSDGKKSYVYNPKIDANGRLVVGDLPANVERAVATAREGTGSGTNPASDAGSSRAGDSGAPQKARDYKERIATLRTALDIRGQDTFSRNVMKRLDESIGASAKERGVSHEAMLKAFEEQLRSSEPQVRKSASLRLLKDAVVAELEANPGALSKPQVQRVRDAMFQRWGDESDGIAFVRSMLDPAVRNKFIETHKGVPEATPIQGSALTAAQTLQNRELAVRNALGIQGKGLIESKTIDALREALDADATRRNMAPGDRIAEFTKQAPAEQAQLLADALMVARKTNKGALGAGEFANVEKAFRAELAAKPEGERLAFVKSMLDYKTWSRFADLHKKGGEADGAVTAGRRGNEPNPQTGGAAEPDATPQIQPTSANPLGALATYANLPTLGNASKPTQASYGFPPAVVKQLNTRFPNGWHAVPDAPGRGGGYTINEGAAGGGGRRLGSLKKTPGGGDYNVFNFVEQRGAGGQSRDFSLKLDGSGKPPPSAAAAHAAGKLPTLDGYPDLRVDVLGTMPVGEVLDLFDRTMPAFEAAGVRNGRSEQIQLWNDADARVVITKPNGEIVAAGFGTMRVGGVASIDLVAVDTASARSGLGSKTLGLLEGNLRAIGAKMVELFISNDSSTPKADLIRFYERHGYLESTTNPGHWEKPLEIKRVPDAKAAIDGPGERPASSPLDERAHQKLDAKYPSGWEAVPIGRNRYRIQKPKLSDGTPPAVYGEVFRTGSGRPNDPFVWSSKGNLPPEATPQISVPVVRSGAPQVKVPPVPQPGDGSKPLPTAVVDAVRAVNPVPPVGDGFNSVVRGLDRGTAFFETIGDAVSRNNATAAVRDLIKRTGRLHDRFERWIREDNPIAGVVFRVQSRLRQGKYGPQEAAAAKSREALLQTAKAGDTYFGQVRKSVDTALNEAKQIKLEIRDRTQQIETASRAGDRATVDALRRQNQASVARLERLLSEAQLSLEQVGVAIDRQLRDGGKRLADQRALLDVRTREFAAAEAKSNGVETPELLRAKKNLAEAFEPWAAAEATKLLAQDVDAKTGKFGADSPEVSDARLRYEQAKADLEKLSLAGKDPVIDVLIDRDGSLEAQIAQLKVASDALSPLLGVEPRSEGIDGGAYADRVIARLERANEWANSRAARASEKLASAENSARVRNAKFTEGSRAVDASAAASDLTTELGQIGQLHSKTKDLFDGRGKGRIDVLANTKKIEAAADAAKKVRAEVDQWDARIGENKQRLNDLDARDDLSADKEASERARLNAEIKAAEPRLADAQKRLSRANDQLALEQRAASPNDIEVRILEIEANIKKSQKILDDARTKFERLRNELGEQRDKLTKEVEALTESLTQSGKLNSNSPDAIRLKRTQAHLEDVQTRLNANEAAMQRANDIHEKTVGALRTAQDTLSRAYETAGVTPGSTVRKFLHLLKDASKFGLVSTMVLNLTGLAPSDNPEQLRSILKQMNLPGAEADIKSIEEIGRGFYKIETVQGTVVAYRVQGPVSDYMMVARLGPQGRGLLAAAIFNGGKAGTLSPSIQMGSSGGLYLTVDSQRIALASATFSTVFHPPGTTSLTYVETVKVEFGFVGVAARLNTKGTNPKTGVEAALFELASSNSVAQPLGNRMIRAPGIIPFIGNTLLAPAIPGMGVALTYQSSFGVGRVSLVYDPDRGYGQESDRTSSLAFKSGFGTGPIYEINRATQPYGLSGTGIRLVKNYYSIYDTQNKKWNFFEYLSAPVESAFDALTFKQQAQGLTQPAQSALDHIGQTGVWRAVNNVNSSLDELIYGRQKTKPP